MPSRKKCKARVKKKKFKGLEASEFLESMLDIIKEGVGFVLYVYYEGGDFETYIMAGDDETFRQLCAHDKEKAYIV